ncbi:lysine biosynthesis protein LysW [Patescibacteria group bacterium]
MENGKLISNFYIANFHLIKIMKCEDCNQAIAIEQGSVRVGDIVDCANCGAEYEITKLDPLKAEIVEEEK